MTNHNEHNQLKRPHVLLVTNLCGMQSNILCALHSGTITNYHLIDEFVFITSIFVVSTTQYLLKKGGVRKGKA